MGPIVYVFNFPVLTSCDSVDRSFGKIANLSLIQRKRSAIVMDCSHRSYHRCGAGPKHSLTFPLLISSEELLSQGRSLSRFFAPRSAKGDHRATSNSRNNGTGELRRNQSVTD